ncbi:hypothetical protein D0T12_33185 [Actinomadura spongiicola]|uniref:Uncharacterized protein n=1 Tax=Actinomadura spongiicola TaxID=2303421 RepID=A0A372G759_9ACTN|nr:hypothetical protein [Actinomadura spongiicola]RFS81228.1 hypothetical protein D0T12_33185 [Actinomadura spongiicola]
MRKVANPTQPEEGEVEATLERLCDAHPDWTFQHLPMIELSWEAFRKSRRFRVAGGVGWLRAESVERLTRQIGAVERAEAALDAEDAHSAVAGTPTRTRDPRVLEELDRLRAEHPDWRIEYAVERDVPWIAFRDRSTDWAGGHPAAEAKDPVKLASLIEQAVQVVAEPATHRGGCTR